MLLNLSIYGLDIAILSLREYVDIIKKCEVG